MSGGDITKKTPDSDRDWSRFDAMTETERSRVAANLRSCGTS